MNRTVPVLLETADLQEGNAPFPLSINHKIVITDEGEGIAECLMHSFEAKGYRAEVVESPSPGADVVIFLNGLTKFKTLEEAAKVNKKAFLASKSVAERFGVKGGLFITVQDTGGKFCLNDAIPTNFSPWGAGLPALIKTAAQEWPKALCKAIDLQTGSLSKQAIGERLLEEILTGGADLECALSKNGKRYVVKNSPEKPIFKKLALEPHSVVVVSGGARGVTAACIKVLAAKSPFRFAILGRTPLTQEDPPGSEQELKQGFIREGKKTPKEINKRIEQILAMREVKETLASIEKGGSTASYFALDIGNEREVAETLDLIRTKWGPIHGIIHGAGVLADKRIEQKTEEQFDSVFNTKVVGLRNLLQGTEKDPLTLIALFSSVAARFGNVGQADYAMANEVLNKIAQSEQSRRGKKCLVKSLNWGPWEGGMVTEQLKDHFTKQGIPLLPIQKGVQLFIDEISTEPSPHVEVVLGGALFPSKLVSTEAYPCLLSHVINGIPVVPVVLAMEFMVETAQNLSPDLYVGGCFDLKVLKGIQVKNPVEIQVVCDKKTTLEERIIYNLSIRSKQTLFYTAKVEMVKSAPQGGEIALPATDGEKWPFEPNEIYRKDRLFHGPDFQVIQTLGRMSSDGGSAFLKESNGIYALDGALQIIFLWSLAKIGKPVLPLSIHSFVQYSATPKGPLQVVLHVSIEGSYRCSVKKLSILQQNGDLYAEICGIEAVAYNI